MSVACLHSRKPMRGLIARSLRGASPGAWIVIKAGGGVGALALTLALVANSLARLPDVACFYLGHCVAKSAAAKPGRTGWTVIVDRLSAPDAGASVDDAAKGAPPASQPAASRTAVRDVANSSRAIRVPAGGGPRDDNRLLRAVRANCERNCN